MRHFNTNRLHLKFIKRTLFSLLLITIQTTVFTQSLWSDPATWGGNPPQNGDNITIPAGLNVLLDEDTPNLSGLTIEGTLTFDNQDLSLTSDWIMVMGELHIGSQTTPFTHQATINLTATNTSQNIMGMGTRGLMVMGGLLELHGTPPTQTWTKINAHAPAGSTSLTLMQSVNWNVNDEIVVAPTDYYPMNGQTSMGQKLTLTQASGNQLTTATGLNAFRWGLLQYATTNGMSLSPTNLITPTENPTPTVLDERAPVGNLTRNIVIQAPDDALWNNSGFGCHIMVMRMGMTQGIAHIDGVEIRRGGQNGNLGRYPFHWHMISYDDCAFGSMNCQTLSDATGQYIRNSSINESAHRGITIHGTNGVTVENNILFGIRGHGVFLEDGSERRNTIDGNLVVHVRNPTNPLLAHESNGQFGAAGFWITNPDNTIINNTAADCESNGFWLAFFQHSWGLSHEVPIHPCWTTFGVFDNNTAHSNRKEGFMLDRAQNTANGGVQEIQYYSTSNGQPPGWPWSTVERYTMSRLKTWKNSSRGFWDRSTAPDNYEFVAADNNGRFFAGAGAAGVIERCLLVGTSLNYMMNGTGRNNVDGEVTPAGFATYHSAFDIQNNIIVNFPAVAGEKSGAFATEDYYLRPVEKGQMRNSGNILVNSHPGVKLMAPYSYFALAGALWDPHGTWSGTPGDDYLVFDTPFFTHGQTPQTVPPSASTGGVLVDGPFYGFNDFVVNHGNLYFQDLMELNVTRFDNTFTEVGDWNIDEAQLGWGLDHMRHFATHPTGYYQLEFPTIPEVTDVYMTITNMLTTSDYQVLAIEYTGNNVVDGVFTTAFSEPGSQGFADAPAGTFKHIYQPVANRQAVLDAADGQVYWHDTANNLVWIKIKGGVPQNWNDADFEAHDNELLYREFWLRIHGTNAALPVELLDFSAVLNDDKNVEIEWSTATEINNDYFIIERSIDSQKWEELATIDGASNSDNRLNYAHLDENPLIGISYYRLKQVDFTGKFSYSNIEVIHFENSGVFEIFPNPVVDNIYLKTGLSYENMTLEIANLKGQLLLKQQINNSDNFEINVAELPAGVYFLKMEADGIISYLKFIK